MKKTFHLEGLQYGDTRKKVINTLESLNGVHNVSVDADDKSISVLYDWPATTNELEHHIKQSGFDISEQDKSSMK